MTPRSALLLVFLAALSVSARAAGPDDPVLRAAAQAFVEGKPVRAAFGAGAQVPPGLDELVKKAEQVQAGGAVDQDDKKFRAAVLASADGFGVKDEEKRAALLRIYLERRAQGQRAPAAASPAGAGAPPDERAALERAARLRARVGATKNPFAVTPSPDGEAGQLRASSVLPGRTAPAAAPAEAGALRSSSLLAAPAPGEVGARIDEALKAGRVQVPQSFKKEAGAVPSLQVGRDGQVATAGVDPNAPSNPDLPPLKWNDPRRNADKFETAFKQDPSKPQSTDDIARIEKTFRATIARLVKEGRRLEGTGNGVANNVWVTFRAKNGARCYEQSEALLEDLAKEFHSPNGVGQFVEPRGRWLFKMTTYFGEGHEANGHYWVTAISREPGDPTLILDPWKGEIERSVEKKPVVAKGYASYWFGYVMDKTVGQ